MAEKYEGKKYNAYIHMQQHSLLMHFHSRVQQSTIWRYVLCMYAYACTCIYTPLCTTDVCCRCLILHVYSFILCVFVDVSCIRIMFCTQLAPFILFFLNYHLSKFLMKIRCKSSYLFNKNYNIWAK